MKELFIKNGWGDAAFLNDIGMENKGLEYSQYMPKESLAQQGGFALTNKGPQHDEAWLIFMDMVNNQIPTFENKAEALHYFPMFRTWFGLVGLCKLPWNDVEPESNAQSDEPAKVPEHVDNYVTIYRQLPDGNLIRRDLLKIQKGYIIFRGYLISAGVMENVNMTTSHIVLPVRLQKRNMNQGQNDMISS